MCLRGKIAEWPVSHPTDYGDYGDAAAACKSLLMGKRPNVDISPEKALSTRCVEVGWAVHPRERAKIDYGNAEFANKNAKTVFPHPLAFTFLPSKYCTGRRRLPVRSKKSLGNKLHPYSVRINSICYYVCFVTPLANTGRSVRVPGIALASPMHTQMHFMFHI